MALTADVSGGDLRERVAALRDLALHADNAAEATQIIERIRELSDRLRDGSPVGGAKYASLVDEWRTPVIGPETGAQPLYVTPVEPTDEGLTEFYRGAAELNLGTKRKPIARQQIVMAGVMQAPATAGTSSRTVIEAIRRVAKTTTIFAVALGRCIEQEDYQVAYAAQTGAKGRDRFLKDLVNPLMRRYGGLDSIPWKINRGKGSESIAFPGGSSISILPPLPENFRGDAYDLVIVDEAQELDPDQSGELLGAIMPTFDTRPGAQLVVAGTAGKHRSGMLWDFLEQGREGKIRIVEYAAPDHTPIESYGDEAVWLRTHPGIGSLTTIDSVRDNFNALSLEAFGREYLGIWPASSTASFIDMGRWEDGELDGELPKVDDLKRGCTLAVAVHPDQSCASIAAAWRTEDGDAHILLVDWRPGVEWVAARAAELARKLRTVIVHDTMGPILVQTEAMDRMNPRPVRQPQTFPQISTAAALLLKDNAEGHLKHYRQERLTSAARIVTKRGTPASNRWAFGRGKNPDADITPIEAASMALRYFDEHGGRRRVMIVPTQI